MRTPMPKVSIPHSLCLRISKTPVTEMTKEELSSFKKVVKSIIQKSISIDLPVTDLDDDVLIGTTETLSFKKEYDIVIRKACREQKCTEANLLLRYLIVGEKKELYHEFIETKIKNKDFTPYLKASSRHERPAQTTFFNYLSETFKNKKIGMVEASTGVGKTLAMLANANEYALKDNCRVVIAVPTIALSKQFADEYQNISSVENIAPLKVVLGMGSFVSVKALYQLLEEKEYAHYKDDIDNWISKGAPAIGQWQNVNTSFLFNSLNELAPNIPKSEISLSTRTESEDEGMTAYKNQFIRFDNDTEILVTTHAMIAVDMRSKLLRENTVEEVKKIKDNFKYSIKQQAVDGELSMTGVEYKAALNEQSQQIASALKFLDLGHLPSWQYILIDEAHLFEENVANTLSNNLSLFGIIQIIKDLVSGGLLPANITNKLQYCFDAIVNSNAMNDAHIGKFKNEESYSSLLVENFFGIINKIKVKKINNDDFRIEHLKNDAKLVLGAISNQGRNGPECILRHSPIKKYPQLIVGYRNNNTLLSRFWSAMTAGSCVSATLYTKKKHEDSASYYRQLLNIPENRYMEFTPIVPVWVKNPVTSLNIPSPSKERWLLPVGMNEKLNQVEKDVANNLWLDDVSKCLSHTYESAQGGVLVLMTSYESVAGIASRISQSIDSDLIVFPNGKLTIEQQKKCFMDNGKKNKKSIWLAVGSAWTGLDVNGKNIGVDDPLLDNIMTDLVIPKVPFGLNRTISHEMRRRNPYYGSSYEVLDTAMRFKQGIGRLVRREGLADNRRVWVLDSRLNSINLKGFLFPITQIINTYNVKHFNQAFFDG